MESGDNSHKTLWSIDIETVSQGKRANDYTDQKNYKLGNVKDPVKVAAKLKEKREEARKKHGFNWITNKIISVALTDVYGDEEHVIMGHNEAEILLKLSNIISKPCKLIGKSSKNCFDFEVLAGRYMANYITVPMVLKSRYDLLDVDDFFGYSASSPQRGSLDDYCHGIGFKPKPEGLNGSMIQDLYNTIIACETVKKDEVAAAAAWKQLHDYNLHDVNAVAALAVLYYGPERIGV
jgi:hypothetical protein